MAVAVRQADLAITGADGEELVDLAALQGLWTEEQYLRLTDSTNRLIEFTDGVIEILGVPTISHQGIAKFLSHQGIAKFLFLALHAFLQPSGGTVFFPVLRLQIRPGKFREPDLLALRDAADPRRQGNRYFLGADLVVEIVSADDPDRDYTVKRADYAQAGIPEYWIVDPAAATITVLRLAGRFYAAHGVFGRGATATSALLPDFAVAVDAVLDAP